MYITYKLRSIGHVRDLNWGSSIKKKLSHLATTAIQNTCVMETRNNDGTTSTQTLDKIENFVSAEDRTRDYRDGNTTKSVCKSLTTEVVKIMVYLPAMFRFLQTIFWLNPEKYFFLYFIAN